MKPNPSVLFRHLSLMLGFIGLVASAAPMLTDANWSTEFGQPGANGDVYALTKDKNGNIYVGGEFTCIGTVFATNIAKWNGSSWSALPYNNIISYGGVGSMACDVAGNLYATAFDNSQIQKWDGTNWTSLDSSPGTTVEETLACDNAGNLYVGGMFTNAGETPANFIAEWNGTNWSALGSGLNSRVYALACDSSGNLYAGGAFTTAGDASAKYIAEWNGSTWSPLGSGVNNAVDALAVDSSGNLYVGGVFTQAGPVNATNIAEWNGSTWSSLGWGTSGTLDTLVFDGDGNLYVGGVFSSSVNGAQLDIAKWNGYTWSNFAYGQNSGYYPDGIIVVSSLTVDKTGVLWAGGDFTAQNGIGADFLAKFPGGVCTDISSGVQMPPPRNFQQVFAMAADTSGNVYLGGQYKGVGGAIATNIAKWNGQVWSTFGTNFLGTGGFAGNVEVMACDNFGNVYVDGDELPSDPMHWNGTNWTTLGSGLNSHANCMACDPEGNLYAGGTLTSAGSISFSGIAEWNGSNWSALGPGINGTVLALALDGHGSLYVAGTFTNAGGVPANNIAEWNGTNWSAIGLGINGTVTCLALDNSGNLYAGGGFAMAGGINANNIAKWNGTAWTSLGAGISGLAAMACDDFNNLYIGGTFTSAGGVPASYFAEWNGSNWLAVGSGFNNFVRSLVRDSYGNVYAGGVFTTEGTNISIAVAELLLSKSSSMVSLANLGSGTNVVIAAATPGISYALDLATNLAAPVNWMPQTTNTASSQTLVFTNVSGYPQGYYRTRYVPQ
jgi:hypothetical protein